MFQVLTGARLARSSSASSLGAGFSSGSALSVAKEIPMLLLASNTHSTGGWPHHLNAWLAQNQDLALWVTGIATAVLALGVIVAWLAVRDAKRTRHGQLIVSLNEQWRSQPILDSLDLYGTYTNEDIAALAALLFDPDERPAKPEEVATYGKLAAAANLIETIGVLCEEQAITYEVVYKLWGGQIVQTWKPWEDVFQNVRGMLGEDDFLIYFDRLGREMVARMPEPPGTPNATTPSSAAKA